MLQQRRLYGQYGQDAYSGAGDEDVGQCSGEVARRHALFTAFELRLIGIRARH